MTRSPTTTLYYNAPGIGGKVHRVDLVDMPFQDLLRQQAHLRYVAHVAAFLLQRAVLHLLLLTL